jgi:hypothetical protein
MSVLEVFLVIRKLVPSCSRASLRLSRGSRFAFGACTCVCACAAFIVCDVLMLLSEHRLFCAQMEVPQNSPVDKSDFAGTIFQLVMIRTTSRKL